MNKGIETETTSLEETLFSNEMEDGFDSDSKIMETTTDDIDANAESLGMDTKRGFGMMEGRSLEINDVNDRELANNGSTETNYKTDNDLLLQQMTVIIIFIMVSGTM